MIEKIYEEKFNIEKKTLAFANESLKELEKRFEKIDKIAEYNQLKVINAMQKNNVSYECMNGSTGYGYNDIGRDTLEKVYADIFNCEKALVRPQIACGTHALYVALSGNLRPDDELLSPVGKPYDTMDEIIGLRDSECSLKEYGVTYKQVDLIDGKYFDYENIKKAITPKTKLVTIQRSKGYDTRKSFSVKEIGELISFIKNINQDVKCMVDNCYGEFVDIIEPTDVGADGVVGSLIKNLGGGIAPCGGYIAGTKEFVDNASYRLLSPGLGAEVGATLSTNRLFYQGLFLAPNVVASSLKAAIFAAHLYERLGYKAIPSSLDSRADIIQAIEFNDDKALIAFCEGIQAAAPVDSFVRPIPSNMPGYENKVIMAAGTFISGSSIELSADAPLRNPYAVYFQGGLTFSHAKFGIIKTLQTILDKKIKKLD